MSLRSGTQKYGSDYTPGYFTLKKLEAQIRRHHVVDQFVPISDYFLDVGGTPRPRAGLIDEFIDIDDLQGRGTTDSRNLALEERIQGEFNEVEGLVSADNMKIQFPHTRGEFLPTQAYGVPSWWGSLELGDFYDESSYGWGFTHQTALEYLKLSRRYSQASYDLMYYHCHYYPGQTSACQNLAGVGGQVSRLNKLIPMVESRITGFQFSEILPEVFAEEDPSVNSGLNGNEQESQVVNYPQSANVRIVISNISMFSTSIPINDIGQLQILSNASNEWRYTLIGHGSTNPPLMTLSGLITKINSMIASGVTPQPPIEPPIEEPIQPPIQPPIEEEPVTTDHIPPPGVEPEVPMVTVTPTEPGQVNWIPEPFFSFINNVFRR